MATPLSIVQCVFGNITRDTENVVQLALGTVDKETPSKAIGDVNFVLAPCVSNISAESVKVMDGSLLITITGTMHALNKARQDAVKVGSNFTWEKVLEVFAQNPLVESVADLEIDRVRQLTKTGVNWFNFDGRPDESVVKEVHAWFTDLISDEDVLKTMKIDVDAMADIVAHTGASIHGILSLIASEEKKERTVMEIGVLRFPDVDFPYFKVYRVKLTAWSFSKHILIIEEDSNGISGEYNVRCFRPREAIIAELTEEVKQKAVYEAQQLLGCL